jgi:hypothetical protein
MAGKVTEVLPPTQFSVDTSGGNVTIVASESQVVDVRAYRDAVFTVRWNQLKLTGNDKLQIEVITAPIPDPKSEIGSAKPGTGVRIGSITAERGATGVDQITSNSADTAKNPLQGFAWHKITVIKYDTNGGPGSFNLEIWMSAKE